MSRPNEDEFEFEAVLEELEDIVDHLDREGVGLDEAIALFERGIERLGAAKEWLESASGRIEELIATSTGELETAPLDEADGGERPDDGGGRAGDGTSLGGASEPGSPD